MNNVSADNSSNSSMVANTSPSPPPLHRLPTSSNLNDGYVQFHHQPPHQPQQQASSVPQQRLLLMSRDILDTAFQVPSDRPPQRNADIIGKFTNNQTQC